MWQSKTLCKARQRLKSIKTPLSWWLGWHLLRGSFSSISYVGFMVLLALALGIAVLITVSSIMNGLSGEIKRSLLSDIPHIEITTNNSNTINWSILLKQLHDAGADIQKAQRFQNSYALLTYRQSHVPVSLRVINPFSVESDGIEVNNVPHPWDDLRADKLDIIIDAQLAAQLRISIGQSVNLSLASGAKPSLKRAIKKSRYFTVTGISNNISSGALPQVWINTKNNIKNKADYSNIIQNKNQSMAIWLEERSQVDDFVANYRLLWHYCCTAQPWYNRYQELFKAMRLEKYAVNFMLMLVVAIAIFNLVSMMSLLIKQKTQTIIMLLSMGANHGQIYRSFFIAGLLLSLIGIALGTIFGVLSALYIDDLFFWWQTQSWVSTHWFDTEGYYVGQLPSQLLLNDVIWIMVVSYILCLPALLIPLTKLFKIRIAKILRHA